MLDFLSHGLTIAQADPHSAGGFARRTPLAWVVCRDKNTSKISL
jgi:hypothetical protein